MEEARDFLNALQTADLRTASLHIDYKADLTSFKINDPAKFIECGDRIREGQMFVRFPDALARMLPNSTVKVSEFCKAVGVEYDESISKLLLGSATCLNDMDDSFNSHPADAAPVFSHTNQERNFSLSVYNGSTNRTALEISDLAQKLYDKREALKMNNDGKPDEEYHELRMQYQQKVANMLAPILKQSRAVEVGARDKVLEINEDCIATGDSIIGVLSAFKKLGVDDLQKRVKINVAVATAQGIMILQQFAKQNNINMEINAGYLAYSLSPGDETLVPETEQTVKVHSNYITYSDEVLEALAKEGEDGVARAAELKKNKFVVGDMGDWVQSMPPSYNSRFFPNIYRMTDTHGFRAKDVNGNIIDPELVDKAFNKRYDVNVPASIYLANGGYFTYSLMKHIEQMNKILKWWDQKEAYQTVVLRASRALNMENGSIFFGVLLKQLFQIVGTNG